MAAAARRRPSRSPARLEGSEVVGVEEEQSADGDEQQRNQLEHGGHDLHGADVAGARVVGEGGQPLDDEGREAGGPAVLADRDQHVEVADGGHGEGRVGHPGGDPVGPGGEEPGEVAEGLAGVHVRAAGAGSRSARRPKTRARAIAPTVSTPKATRLIVPYGAMDAGSRKMPPPMMLPMTSAVATGSRSGGCAVPCRRRCRRGGRGRRGCPAGPEPVGDGSGDVHGVVRLSSNGCPGSPGADMVGDNDGSLQIGRKRPAADCSAQEKMHYEGIRTGNRPAPVQDARPLRSPVGRHGVMLEGRLPHDSGAR